MTSTRVHLKTLGCRLNEAELETWAREFRSRGWEPVGQPDNADLVVVNTCAVTEEAARKSRQLMRRSQRSNPHAKLVVSGCYATLDQERMHADLGVDLVVPNSDKQQLVDIALREFDFPAMPAQSMEAEAFPLLRSGRQRAFVKVQDGCRYRCSYCIVTLARGAESSRPVAEVVAEIDALQASGIEEVVLAGVHLGGYGADQSCDLGALIEAVLADTDIQRLRLGSLEPWDLPDNFWKNFENPRLMPHLHLPMQSGSDSVLRRMSRRCRAEEFQHLAHRGRAAVPDLNITTDMIVGFPGESVTEWQETLDFVSRVRFGHIHIFAYSPRAGTKAAGLPQQIARDIKRERSTQLHALAAQHKAGFMAQHVGREFEVLFENSHAEGETNRWSGYTPNYLRVQVDAPAGLDLENRCMAVRASACADDAEALYGELLPPPASP